MRLRNRVLFFLILFFIFSLAFYYIEKKDIENKIFYIEDGLNTKKYDELLYLNFENNSEITVGQILVFFARISEQNVKNYVECLEFDKKVGISLPSNYVYNKNDWLSKWKDIALGKIVFEKKDDNLYSLELINGYLKIYLNEKGFLLIQKGLIPPQLYFYSPYITLTELDDINLNKSASLGFILEILMSYEYSYSDRHSIIKENIVKQVEEVTNIPEKNWTSNEIALFDYYNFSYFGQYSYFQKLGILPNNIELKDMVYPINIEDCIVLLNNIFEFK